MQESSRRLPAGPLASVSVLAALYLVLLGTNWRRGVRPLIDFGREVYTAWRLSAGDLLYRDVASLFGPLAPYVDATAFAVFGGPSLSVMFAVNALLIAVATGIVYTFLFRTSGHMEAFFGALTFLGVFAFGPYGSGNYTFLAPYSRAAVWGVVLGMASVACLERWLARRGGRGSALAAGLLAGATLLTKPEVALAVVGTAFLAPATAWWARIDGWKRVRRGATWLLVGIAAPAAAAFSAFWIVDSASLGLEALVAPFRPVFSGSPLSMAFYQSWLGLSDPVARLSEIVGAALALGAGLLAVGFLERALPATSGGRSLLVQLLILLSTGFAVVLLGLSDEALVRAVPRATPVLLLAGLVWSVRTLRRSEVDGDRRRVAALSVWLVFSLLLFLKLGLRPRFHHYGFYLAAPGAVALAVVLGKLAPRWVGRLAGSGRFARRAGLGLLAALALASTALNVRSDLHSDRVRLGSGGDAVWAEGDGTRWVEKTLEHVKASTPPEGTLAVLPEGASLNYWSRRVNPTPFVSFMPPELAYYGPDRMLRALKTSPPDAVVLWNRDLEEYGADRFGASPATGSTVLRFVRRHYTSVATIPASGEQIVFEVLTRTR